MTDALRELTETVLRFRRTRCETMKFGLRPQNVIDAVQSELDEVRVADSGSVAQAEEAADLLGAVVHLIISLGGNPSLAARDVSKKINRRLNHIDNGGTWKSAKEAGL